MHAVLLTAYKGPKVPDSVVEITHPGRPKAAPKPARPRDENGRVPVQIDPMKAARFFGAISRA